jgi:hypothetical protein
MEKVTNSSLQFTGSTSNFFTTFRKSYGMGTGYKKSAMTATANVGENQMPTCSSLALHPGNSGKTVLKITKWAWKYNSVF